MKPFWFGGWNLWTKPRGFGELWTATRLNQKWAKSHRNFEEAVSFRSLPFNRRYLPSLPEVVFVSGTWTWSQKSHFLMVQFGMAAKLAKKAQHRGADRQWMNWKIWRTPKSRRKPIGKQQKGWTFWWLFWLWSIFCRPKKMKQKKKYPPQKWIAHFFCFFSKHQGSAGFWYGFSHNFWVQQNHQ